jgi:hypothetical protein
VEQGRPQPLGQREEVDVQRAELQGALIETADDVGRVQPHVREPGAGDGVAVEVLGDGKHQEPRDRHCREQTPSPMAHSVTPQFQTSAGVGGHLP